jgi:DNA-binding GntR family transcriptional regulator
MLIALTEENFEALHESRTMIEGAIGRLLAEKIDAPTIARLEGMVEMQHGLVDDPVAFRMSDTQFHRTLGAALSNPFLERISEALFVLGMEYRKMALETPDVLSRSVGDHGAIVAALERRDAAHIEEAMVRHMRTVYETTRPAVASTGAGDG